MIRLRSYLLHHHERPRGAFLFYNEGKGVFMDFGKVLGDIKEKFNLSDEQCQKAGGIFSGNFNPTDAGNKETIVGLLKDKLKLDEKKASDIYDAVANALSSGVANDVIGKVKGFFGK